MKAIILAAGECSRFWPLAQDRHKTMYEVGGGRPVLWYTISNLIGAGVEDLIMIIGPQDSSIREYFNGQWSSSGVRLSYIIQPKPLGMGNAILGARELLSPQENFLVVNGSQINGYQAIVQEKRALKLLVDRVLLFGQKTTTPEQYGIMELCQGRAVRLTEKPKEFVGDTRVLGIYALPYWFLEELAKFEGEYSLETALASVLNKNGGVRGVVLTDELFFPSLKFPWDLLEMNRYEMDQWNLRGIRIERGDDVEIHPSALIYGPVIIHRGAKILEGAVVKGPCFIDEGATIGTYAMVRDYSHIGRGVMVGAFSEVKNSLLYEGVSLHGNFVGDSILDRGVHLGAGTKTANTKLKNAGHKHVRSAIKGAMTNTGRTKLGMIVGADSSLGINGSIFPGVKIGQRVQVWPGTIVDTDIPDGFLCRPANTNVLVSRRSS